MNEFYSDNIFLTCDSAKRLYSKVSDLPIIDYHCHISPKEIYEDKAFDNIGEMWLSGDHYKWRLMRGFGIGEEYITGEMPWKEKFIKYAETLALAAGNPLYHWTHMELKKYFGINFPLNEETARTIWDKANEVIKNRKLSPRKLIEMSKVRYIATTDDAADSLKYHKLLKADSAFKTVVAPAFRTDNLLLIRRPVYANYIKKLASSSGVMITDFKSFLAAVQNRLDYFKNNGCKFSDVGIEYFPHNIGTQRQADDVFGKALDAQNITDEEYSGFLGYMHCFLAGEYKKRDIVMQLHIAVKRSANTALYNEIGPDCGGDCVGDVIKGENIIRILDAINSDGGLPKTIIYPLNPEMLYSVSTIAGSFKDVTLGAAWWFNDHKRGIEQLLSVYAETGHLGSFLGMLTDSRSFLSYARHDYFRRILCGFISEMIEKGEFVDNIYAEKLVKAICYDNINKVISV